ncbi:MAG: MFS transporter [Planctomycetes bacterium]|nr:MFS transporter [Planctomycetota bacterium]
MDSKPTPLDTSAGPGETLQGTLKRIGRFRWTICALLFFATTINYMDRQVLGILAPTLEKQISGWDELQYGHIVMAFQAAYALGLLLFGWLIDIIGTKRGYSLAIVVWSLAAMAHALARTVLGFGVARFALGLGEAGNFPAAIKAVAEWFPKKERALATGLFNSGSNVGAILAPVVVPWLTVTHGWQAAFIALGALGFLWIVFWAVVYDVPEKLHRLGADELAYIQSDPAEAPALKVPWGRLFIYRQTWAYVLASLLISPVWWFYLYWLPKFLAQYGLSLIKLGPPLIVIYSATCVGSIGGGWLSSWLLARGWSVNAARKTVLLICALCTLPVVVAAQASLWVAVGLIALAASAHQGFSANLYTTVSDMFPKRAVASVVGLGSMMGSLWAMGFAELAGVILQRTENYTILFVLCGTAYIIALALFHAFAPHMEPARMDEVPGNV